MKISQLITELQELQIKYGDLECKTLDTYLESEGYDLEFMDEYAEAMPTFVELEDENSDRIEKFIVL